MTDPKNHNRIPFEDIDSPPTAWTFPSWDKGSKVVPSVKKRNPTEANGRVEDVKGHSIQPMTAQQLQHIRDEAEREGREQGFKTGHDQGFAEGEKKGLKLGEQKAYKDVKQTLDEQTERFRMLSEALLDPVAMQDGQLENIIVDMAVHLAKHLINQELSIDPTSLFHLVEQAVGSLPAGAQHIRIYLHTDDVELAHEAFEGSGRDWSFYVDKKLSRGGCRIESSQSLIDFSIEKRLQDMLDDVNFQGDIDPDELPTVGDYRPLADEADDFSDDDISGGEEAGEPLMDARTLDTSSIDNDLVDDAINNEQFNPDPLNQESFNREPFNREQQGNQTIDPLTQPFRSSGEDHE
jgi:flagellar assembly protein FliH